MRMLSCALLLAAVAAAQSLDELLPESTVFYVSIENAARTKERWGKSRIAALLNDEAMQAFAEKPRAVWKDWMEQLQREDVFSPQDVLELLSGQAVLAGVWPEGAEEPAPLILADIGENSGKLHDLVGKIEKRLVEEKGDRRDEEEFRGVKIVSYSSRDAEEGQGDAGAWLLDGKLFAMAEDVEALKDMLVRKDRAGEGTLASRELYRRTRGRLGARASDVFLYVDAPNLLAGLQGSGDVDEQTMKLLGAFGISAIEGLAAEFSIESEGLALRMFLPVNGEKRGVLKLFDGKNSALLPPRYVPADALTAGAWTIDSAAVWEEVRRILVATMGEMAAQQMDARFAMLKEQIGVDIPGDIIASLGNGISYHTLEPAKGDAGMGMGGPAALPMGATRFVLAVQLKERERFEAALEKLLTASGLAPATQDYLGVKIRKIMTPFGVQPAFAVLPDRVLFSLSADDVKDVITRYGKETKGFVDREDMAAALAGMPAQRFMIAIDDMPRSLSAASSSLATMMALMRGRGLPPMFAAVDFSLFPAEEVLRKYLGMNVGCLVNEEDGVSYVSMLHFVPAE